jgi:hypothetical protein
MMKLAIVCLLAMPLGVIQAADTKIVHKRAHDVKPVVTKPVDERPRTTVRYYYAADPQKEITIDELQAIMQKDQIAAMIAIRADNSLPALQPSVITYPTHVTTLPVEQSVRVAPITIITDPKNKK